MEKKKRGLAIGVSDFKKLIKNNEWYVDKTKFIEGFIDDRSEVKLFTRPRRFGKTLNMSMLKYFFDVKNAEENRKLFEGLYISKSEYMKYQGQHPVIFISLRNGEAINWKKSFSNVQILILNLYRDFKFLREKLEDYDLDEFNRILKKDESSDWESSLKNLSRYLYEYYGKKVVILIDEYDVPMVSAWNEGYYEESKRFFKDFYSNALKDNEYLEFAAVTGILRVAREGIFSGLNNLKTYTILNEKYAEFFGLTDEEIQKSLEYYELSENIDEVRKWYNGYKFGEIQIYNPWSILNYLDERKIGVYWINTSDNKLIHTVIKNADRNLFDDLKKVFNKGTIEQYINTGSNMENLRNPEEVWQLLLFGGYLTVEKETRMNTYELRLPNYEVKTFFENLFVSEISDRGRFIEIIEALKNLKMEIFEELLNETFLVSMSYHDTEKNEKPYHTLILGMMLFLDNEYLVVSNNEAGYGRNDLALEPIDKKQRGYIFEFKIAENEEKLEEKADEALNQIEMKKYPTMLKERGVNEMAYVGMAFCGKKVRVKYKKMI